MQVISLQRCHKVTDVGLASVASGGMLRVLGANKVHSLGLLTIKALIAACRHGPCCLQLESVTCNAFKLPAHDTRLGLCSEKLEEADFSWCRGISNKALGLLADSCPQLRKLTLFGCSQVTHLYSLSEPLNCQ